jgi:hypothetical protein
VDLGDLGIIAANWSGLAKTWWEGDFTGDGAVTLGDLGILAGSWGWGGTAEIPVPEPGSASILLLGALAVLRGRQKAADR